MSLQLQSSTHCAHHHHYYYHYGHHHCNHYQLHYCHNENRNHHQQLHIYGCVKGLTWTQQLPINTTVCFHHPFNEAHSTVSLIPARGSATIRQAEFEQMHIPVLRWHQCITKEHTDSPIKRLYDTYLQLRPKEFHYCSDITPLRPWPTPSLSFTTAHSHLHTPAVTFQFFYSHC